MMLLPTYGGFTYAGPPFNGAVLFRYGEGTLSLSGNPTITGKCLLGGRGSLNFPGSSLVDSVPVRVMALKSGITAATQRFALQSDMEPAGADIARSGLFPATGYQPADLVQVTALQAKVTPFQAFIAGDSTTQPGYQVTVDEDTILTFDPGSGSDPRVDLVVLRVRDDPYDASGTQSGSLDVVAGTPAPSPLAPAVPDVAVPLWEVAVAGAVTGAVGIDFAGARTDRRYFTASSGGHFTVYSQVERDAIVAPYDGMPIWRADRNWTEVYDGTAWRVQGIAIVADVSGLSYITDPIDGQAAVTFSTNDLLIWDQGTSSWLAFVASALPTGYGPWAQYTPSLTQSGTVTKTVTSADYSQAGKIVNVAVALSVTGGSGLANNAVKVGLPVTAARSSGAIGRGFIYDASASTYYTGVVLLDSTTGVKFISSGRTGFLGATGGGFTAALGLGDIVTFTAHYEAA